MFRRKIFAAGSHKLGTFGGVFTPSILTILGIILFRRTGYVVGHGLGQALIIIAIANCISILTSLSLAAIATNIRVKGGGDYYLISRTLGVEFGGAIGIVLFVAQSVSIGFYCVGFGEALAAVLPWTHEALPRILAGCAVSFLFVFAWLGTDWATRLQYVVMTVLGLALASFFAGGLGSWEPETLANNWAGAGESLGFWVLFGIFFPAVTGFTQGVSMSGDLKDAGRSLPRGTFVAVGVSFAIYVGAALVFAASLRGADLTGDYDVMERVAVVGWLIPAGVIAATMSSAMASYLGAPRILQAMAVDRILPFHDFFSRGKGRANNPRRAVLASTFIALATVLSGDLNAIAPVISMFFLISYGLLNYATYYEARAASPSFRPRFRWFDKRLSLLGAVGCVGAMAAINPIAAVVAGSVLFGVFQYLKRTAGPSRWAHGLRSYNFQRIRELLFEMDAIKPHSRDWRPQILAFSKDDHRREQLLRFASWIEGGSGLTTAVSIVEGTSARAFGVRDKELESLQSKIEEKSFRAFPLVVAGESLRSTLEVLLQAYGVGPLKANVILLNWLEQRPEPVQGAAERVFGRNLREAIRLGCNIVVLDAEKDEWSALDDKPAGERRIDVWWGEGATSRLMLLLAYLMTRTENWDGSIIRVLAEGKKKRPERTLAELEEMLAEVRIQAKCEIAEDLDVEELTKYSTDASMVFIPLQLRGNQPAGPLGERLEGVFERLPVVALVLAGEDIDLDAEPEEGEGRETPGGAEVEPPAGQPDTRGEERG